MYQPPPLPPFPVDFQQQSLRIAKLKWSVLWLLFASLASGAAALFFVFSFLIIPIFFGILCLLAAAAMLVVSLVYAITA